MTDPSWIDAVAASTGLIAAVLGLKAATITVRDSMDQFIDDLHRQGRYSGLAASFAAMTALLVAVRAFVV
ncbi:MAG: hypothetical protein RLO08_19640 [Parvibaculaceae bacterium]|nr:hypothetical protein [Kangiella sp.]